MIDISNLSLETLPDALANLSVGEIIVLVIMGIAIIIIFLVFVRLVLLAITRTFSKSSPEKPPAQKAQEQYQMPSETQATPEKDVESEKKRIMEQLKKELESTK